MNIPQAEKLLPDLMTFVHQCAAKYEGGEYTGWADFIADVRAFYTPECMDHVDSIVRNWKMMASYADGQTLIHVTAVLIKLVLEPEYHRLTAEQQNLALWSVLYHDVGKIAQHKKRDAIHALISASITAKALPQLGFLDPPDETALAEWCTLTETATIYSEQWNDPIQDTSKLPRIVAGIERLFGLNSPAGLILQVVLHHMAITVVERWPAFAPLDDEEICSFVTPSLYPLLRVMMLTDSDSWEMFNPETNALHHAETLTTFEHIKAMMAE